jgi:leucyl aminopeptidase
MTSQHPNFEVTAAPARDVPTDLLVVPAFNDDDLADVIGLDAATGGELTRAREAREFKGKPYELFFASIGDRGWRARRVILVGAGDESRFSIDQLRRTATAAGLAARQRHVRRLGFVVRGVADRVACAKAAAEGLALADFDGGTYKTQDRDDARLDGVHIIVPEADEATRDGVTRGALLGACSNLARGLANEPSNVLTPREFADRAAAIAGETGIKVEVLDERRIEELKMGLLLGVARGSAEPPRIIVMRYEPPLDSARGGQGARANGPTLGLIGKGVTFDTGGISIKPADGMDRMKDDMAGGAAVATAMRAIGALKPPIRVIGVVPATENMPGGRATKPGDVLTSASGKTVEVVNTDAEGRLILGDALWYAHRLGATHLVDVATLTGACVVALGKLTTGLFGTPDWWVNVVRETAEQAGDRVWPMPVFDEYLDQIKSDIADLMNSGGRPAGAITAAMFLKEFTNGLPWAHMDIAGTAWSDDARPYQPKGASGVAVRTLAELPFTYERWQR